MKDVLRPLGIVILVCGFVVLLTHGLRTYRIQSGLAELDELRRSMIDGSKTNRDAQNQRSEFNKIRDDYRRRGISHPHYEEAFQNSFLYYGGGLILVVVGAVMFRFSRKSAGTPEPTAADGSPADESDAPITT